jgi:hypothetical protein
MAMPAENTERAGSARLRVASGPCIPNINPVTGLSTDYLNHFTEAIMALEMANAMPECLDDLKNWRPKTYAEHFAASRFRNREAVIRAYQAADPALRNAIDAASETLNATLAATRDAVVRHGAAAAETLARHAFDDVRPLIARMAAMINGSTGGLNRTSAQAAIDAMFAR